MRDDSAVRAHGGAKARWTMLGMMAAVVGMFVPMVLVETVAQASPTVGPCSNAGTALDSLCIESSADSPTQPPYDLGISKGDRITDFKWLVNADDTGDPSLTTANVNACLPARAATTNPAIYANAGSGDLADCPWPSVHTASGHSAVVSSGDQTQVGALNNLPDGKYLISVTAADHKIDGVHFTVDGNLVYSVNDILGAPFVVEMNPMPKKTATVRVHVYNDNASTNGQWDGQTETLLTCADSDPDLPLPAVCQGNADPTTVVDPETDMSGFSVSIADVLDSTTTDVYNNPLCTQYVEGDGGILLDDSGAPIPLMFGDGGASGGALAGTESTCLSDHYGDIVIPNMGPNRYAVSVIAPDPRSHNGDQWVQTTTLEGGHDWDSWNIEGGTGYDTELIVGGERVTPVAHGFVKLTHSDADRAAGMSDATYYNAAPGFNGGPVGHGVLTGRIRIGRAYVGSGGAQALAGVNITNAKEDGPIEDGLISISCLAVCNAPTDSTVWTGRASAVDGSFTVTGLQTGDYSVAFWDESQSYIMIPMAFHIDGDQTQPALPTVLSAVRAGNFFNRTYTLTFNANPNLAAGTPMTLTGGNNGWSGTFQTTTASTPSGPNWTVRVTAVAPTFNPFLSATVMPQAFAGPLVNPAPNNISDVLLAGWFTDLQGHVFVDTNGDGIHDPGEQGIPDFGLTVRTRGNSLQDQGAAIANTDEEGAYDLSQAYPLGQFLIAEAYNPRFKSTGYSYWTDNDPEVHSVISAQVDIAFLPVIGLSAHLDWGVQPYEGDENGGIVGTVSYDVTRNEFDPAFSGPEDYQPSVSDLPVQLWKTKKTDGINPDTTGSGALQQVGISKSTGLECDRPDTLRGTDAVQAAGQDCKPFDYYITETFARPTGCMALDVNGAKLEGEMALPDSPATKPAAGSDFWSHTDPNEPDCVEAPMSGFQIGGDGTVDGNYALTNLITPSAITGSLVAGGDELASLYLDTKDVEANWAPLPSADYVVEVVSPEDPYNTEPTTDHNVGGYFADPASGTAARRLYKFTDETAINVMTGDSYVPQGGYEPSGDPDGGGYSLATSTIDNIRQDVNTLGTGTVAKCAGSLQTVDQSNNPDLADNGGSPYVGTDVPVCDSKLVKVVGGRSMNPTFFVYTDVPIPSKFYGLVNDDLNLQTDRRSILLGEVAPVANGPVGIYDENGNWKYTAHSDVNGFYEVILPSMDTYNCPLPAGPCPNVYRLVGNDPGTLTHRNLDYNPQFRTISTEFQAWTGVIHPVDQAPTHQGITIEGPAAQFGALSLCKLNDANTLATQMTPEFFTIDKPYYNPASDGSKNYVVKGSGFGSSVGTLTLGNTAVTVTPANWTDNQLTFQIPTAVKNNPGPYQLSITNSASGLSTVNGLTFHSLATNSSYYRIQDVYEVRSNDAAGAPILRDNTGSRIFTPMHDAWDTVDQTGPGGFSGIDNNSSLPMNQRQVSGGRAIQRAIEAAHGNNGSTPKLIVIYPNTAANYAPHNANAAYFENVVIHGKVKLQGVGPGGVITSTNIVHGATIDASQFWSATQVVPPGGNQQTSDGTYSDDWRTFAAGLPRAGTGPVDIPEGEGVLAIAESTNQYANVTVTIGNGNNARTYDDLSVAKSIFQTGVDGLQITGGDQQGNPGNINTTPGAVGDVIGGPTNPGPAQGGAIMLDQYVRDFNITNNQIQSNGGTYGTIRVGTPDLGAGRDAQNNHNQRLNVANNRIVANGGTNLAGALGLFFGADKYTVTGNDFCGNFSAEYGGAVSHYGSSPGGLISKNRIYYNQGYDEGGGIFIAGNLPGNNNALSLGAGGTWVNGFTGSGNARQPINVTDGVTVDSNTLISNQSNDDGGGLRFLMGGNFPFLVKNNIIANNLSTHEGGGVALDDTMNVTLANNTIVKNITTATAATNSGINTILDPNTKPANPAGLSSGGNSTLFQASLPNNSPNWSKPKMLNNIFADNRAGWAVLPSPTNFNTSSLHGVELADAQRWDVGVPSANGLCNALNRNVIPNVCTLPFGFDGGFNTTNAVATPLHANVGAYSFLGTNNFPAGSDGAGVGGIGFKNPQDFAVDSLMWRGNTAVSYPVIVAHLVPVSLLADYHLANTASATYAVNVGGASYLSASPVATVNAPTVDIDGDGRPALGGWDRGADEIRGTTANLSISKDDGVGSITAGSALTYTITVHNGGPDAVTGAAVTDTMPATLTNVTWACVGSCTPASGSGNINATVDLANGANATFTVSATVALAATGSVVNTATVAAPFGVTDSVPGNNSATDTDIIPPPRPILGSLDNFNRANANNLNNGSNWTQLVGPAFLGSNASIRVNGSQAFDQSILVPGTAFWSAAFGTKQGAAMTIANTTLNGDSLLLKASGSLTLSVYQTFIRVRVTGTQVVVETTTNNGLSYTNAATLTGTFANGDTITAQVDATGRVDVWNGTTWVGQAATTFTGAGRIGIQLPNGARGDDFAGGTLP